MGIRHILTLFVVVAAVMGGIALLTRWLLSYWLAGAWCRRGQRGLLLIDSVAILGLLLSRSLLQGFSWAAAALQFVSIFFMAQLIFSVLMLLALVIRFLFRRMMAVPVDRGRRRLLRHAVLVPTVAGAAGLYGGLYERQQTVENHYVIPVEKLPHALAGYTIAQLSDIHLGLFFSLEKLEALLEQAARLGPDVLVITGDLFDYRELNAAAAGIVDRFCARFPQGIFFCRGNHEHLRGIDEIEALLSKTKIQELVNSSRQLRPGMPLYFAGVDYPMERSAFAALQAGYTEKAFADVPAEAVKVLLAHHPDFITSGRERQAVLTLTGHTHGGQIGFLGMPLVPPVFSYMRGMYQQGNCYGYVHSGNGSWFPYRLGCPPEIACFRLQPMEEKTL